MRMRSLSSLLLLVLCCCPFVNSFAASGFQLAHRTGDYFVTAQEACDAAISDAQAQPATSAPPVTVISANVGASASVCTFNVKRTSDGQIFNNQGYPCSSQSPNCQLTTYSCDAGVDDSLTWPRYMEDAAGNTIPGTEVPIFSNPVCSHGCEAEHTASVDDCFYDGTNFLFCVFPLKRKGPTCSSPTTAPDTPSDCPSGYENVGGKCKLIPPVDPCVAEPTGEGCTGGGDTGGGDTGGGDTGGGDTGGGDTGGGDTGGGDTGGGDTGGGDTGGGDTGGGDTGGGDTGSAGGLGCNDPFVCSGDSVGCAMVQLQKIQRCESERGLDPELGKAGIAEAMKDPDGEIEEEEIQIASLLSGHARFLPSSCPPAQTFTVWGRQFAFKNDYFCNFATSMSWLVVAMASLFAAVYIGKSVGGS